MVLAVDAKKADGSWHRLSAGVQDSLVVTLRLGAGSRWSQAGKLLLTMDKDRTKNLVFDLPNRKLFSSSFRSYHRCSAGGSQHILESF